MQTAPASAGVDWRRRLVADASLEVTVRDKDAAALLRERLAPGSRVHVTCLPSGTYRETVTQAAALARAGLSPVPHIAARSLASAAELDDFIARIVGEAGAAHALLIAGDLERPRGPFTSSLDVLRTGGFERHGLRGIGFAAHPEGHPTVPADIMAQALADKVTYAAEHGLAPEIVTQFCFAAEPVLACVRALRLRGITAPVRIGAAAPTDPARMLRFALRCGVGPSLRALEKHAARLGAAAASAGPENLVADLAAGLGEGESGAVHGMHFFVFGGVRQAADWLQQWRAALEGA